jgi:hypothetical protein
MMKKIGRFRGEGWIALWKGSHHGHAIDYDARLTEPW